MLNEAFSITLQHSTFSIQHFPVSAYTDALRQLSRRELSVAECRSRLADLEHSDEDIERAIAKLLETGGLDDARLAREYARTAAEVKGRGRIRVQQELQLDLEVRAGRRRGRLAHFGIHTRTSERSCSTSSGFAM